MADQHVYTEPTEEHLCDLADLYRVFADSTRVRLLWELTKSELCVSELCEALGASQSAISHQLRTLRAAKLVKARRVSRMMKYSLLDDHVHQLLKVGLDHVRE